MKRNNSNRSISKCQKISVWEWHMPSMRCGGLVFGGMYQQHPKMYVNLVYDFLRETERVDPNYFRPAEQIHGHDGSALDAAIHAFMVMVFLEENKVIWIWPSNTSFG
mmetsp:Transcript_55761/g.135112  ORF Transcript_55761/g.135112 Transcript_55761/m.135112 type:complete len:107 (-) Transcript_55761:534-854(-)